VILGAVITLASRPAAEQRPRPAQVVVRPAGKVQVEVLNGTGRQGAARTATRMLRQQGFDVVFLGNADSAATATRVIARRGDSTAAQAVARTLGSGGVVVQTDTLRRVDVSVVLGDDFRPALQLHP
jgi:predicted short-subunit dehydrogenase-like oxidoreductase (DUF2520 family)